MTKWGTAAAGAAGSGKEAGASASAASTAAGSDDDIPRIQPTRTQVRFSGTGVMCAWLHVLSLLNVCMQCLKVQGWEASCPNLRSSCGGLGALSPPSTSRCMLPQCLP